MPENPYDSPIVSAEVAREHEPITLAGRVELLEQARARQPWRDLVILFTLIVACLALLAAIGAVIAAKDASGKSGNHESHESKGCGTWKQDVRHALHDSLDSSDSWLGTSVAF
jgi:hypothetical protein